MEMESAVRGTGEIFYKLYVDSVSAREDAWGRNVSGYTSAYNRLVEVASPPRTLGIAK